ncbi:hypothetical protein [Yanshouia hominis]|uniref:Uncharacterized protein n=1 Tax=Yanshouia hominis TaxID=2763673 RepID=A0ABR7NII4_9FIRM|nr:hypothetical protein [Yanshouia hominis]MBC8576236.1 hypothetical protein [Yanshouia hominis]
MMQKRWLSVLLALSLSLIPTTVLADGDEAGLSIKGGGNGRVDSAEQATLKAEGGTGENGYHWYRNDQKIPLPEKDADGNLLPTDSITTDRTGDYYVKQGDSQSGTVRIVREFDSKGSTALVIGKRSNTLAKRKDSQIEKLEARVAQAAADAEKPLPKVSLGEIYGAVEAAASSNGTVTLRDAGVLEPANQAVLARRIGEEGLADRLYADQVADYKVTTRLSLVPSRISSAVDLGLSLGDEELTALFGNAFSNRLLVIDAAQDGFYGQTVEMMVKGDPVSGSRSLSFYRYDPDSNRCAPVSVSGVHFDQKGYLHFRISSGGILIVSDGDLSDSSM